MDRCLGIVCFWDSVDPPRGIICRLQLTYFSRRRNNCRYLSLLVLYSVLLRCYDVFTAGGIST